MSTEKTVSPAGLQRVKVNAPTMDAMLTEAEQVMQRAQPRARDVLRVEPVYQEADGSWTGWVFYNESADAQR